MDKTASIMELVSGYEAYAVASDLGVGSAADAPATSTPCIATVVSSAKCASVATAASASAVSATYEISC